MKYCYTGILLILAILNQYVQAQSVTVSGFVFSESRGKALENASVQLIDSKDSTLIAFGRTNSYGHFEITAYSRSSMEIHVFYPGSIEYGDTIPHNFKSIKLDTIRIIDAIVKIKEAVIRKYIDGIRLSGDTTEYLADFFKTNPGATVEDLLKKLPGIQVNRNGEITAQGQKVKKILVDGEEFFADDPSIATKYLRADMIDKVQVYNENKDTLTGNTGAEIRTMNLTMKDGKNKGYFGKLEAGSNFNEYTNAGAFAGYFKKSFKAAGYLKTSNFENAALNWSERNQFGSVATGGSTYRYGNFMTSGSGESFNDQMDSRGIPNNVSGGAMSNITFSKKVSLNASYRYASEGLNGNIIKSTDFVLPDTAYTVADTTDNQYKQDGQRLNLTFTVNPDSFNRIVFSGSGGINNGSSSNLVGSKTSNTRNINDNARETLKEYNKLQLRSSVNWEKRFIKPGRSLGVTGSYNHNESESEQKLKSTTQFYAEAGNIKNSEKIEQTSTIVTSNKTGNVSVTFNENLGKKFISKFAINSAFNEDINQTNTTNNFTQTEVDSLSNHYKFGYVKHGASMILTYKLNKLSFYSNIGGGISDYNQYHYRTTENINRRFINFLPGAGVTYNWQKQSELNISYSGSNQAPSLSAIQPIINISDPLNRTVGNPDLVQAFNHTFNAYINSFKTLKGRYMWGYGSLSIPKNAFVTSTEIDSSGLRQVKTINADGNYNFFSNVNYNMKLKKLPVTTGFELGFNRSKNITYTNNHKIITYSTSPSLSTDIDFETDDFEFGLSYGLSYNLNQSGTQSLKSNSYFIHTPGFYLEMHLPYNFHFETEGDFNIRPATEVFRNNRNVYYINAELKKKFTKKNNVEFSFRVNDILNQNIGFNRFIGTNQITEEVYSQLRRYWLIHLRWNFSQAGDNKNG